MEEVLLAGIEEVLNGLGASQKDAIKGKILQIAQGVQNRAKVVPTEIQRFATRTDRMNSEQKLRWNPPAGKKREVEPSTLHKYRIVKLTSGGDNWIELIKDSIDAKPGVTNFKDQVMDAKEVAVIDRIGLSFAIDPTNAVVDGYKLNFSNYGIAWDDLANGELQVGLGSGGMLLDMYPLKNFVVTEAGAAPTNLDPKNFYASIPVDNVLWDDETKLKVNVRFGQNTVVPTGSAVWVRIDLICGGLRP